MFPIRFNCFSSVSPASWPQIMVNWLGHVWTYCTSHLSNLMQRVSVSADAVFSANKEGVPLAEEDPSLPNSPAAEDLIKKEDEQIDPSVEKVLATEKKNDVALEGSVPTPPADPGKDQPLSPQEKVSEPPKNNKPEEDEEILNLEELFDKDKPAPQVQIPTKTDQPNEQDPASLRPEGGRRRRRNRKKAIPLREFLKQPDQMSPNPPANNSATQSAKPAEAITPAGEAKATETPAAPVALEPFTLECGGGGDCQLHALLKGLEMQHPQLANYEKDGKSYTYTHLDLRQMGVNFAREQVDKCGVFAEEVLAYLDTDRKEHNESAVSTAEANLKEENENLDKARKEKKLTPVAYDRQKKALVSKYNRIADHIEKNVLIRTDAEFLNRLEKKGFYCSTLHLFSLSFLLKVPIFVHEKNGTPGHDIQRFNPTDSQLDPVHLYRVGRCHYQLIVFPK